MPTVRKALEQGAEDFQATLVQQGQEKTVTLRLPAMTEEELEIYDPLEAYRQLVDWLE